VPRRPVPKARGIGTAARVATVATVVLAVIVTAILLFSPGNGYEVRIRLTNASQLVRGDWIEVGGVPVGSVKDISLAPDGEAEVKVSIDDGRFSPLHEGSRVEVRSASLSGIANRYLALTPGPNNRPKIADGAVIPSTNTTAEVDLDEVLNALDPQTQRDLRTATRGAGSAFSGPAGRQLNAAIEALNPAISQTDGTEREILRDEPTFERFLLESADVVGAVAQRPEQLTQLVGNARGTLQALASRDNQLDSLLQRLPDTLRSANTTLVNLRGAIGDIRPTVRALRPVAPPLTTFLLRLRPITREAIPVIREAKSQIDRPGTKDLVGVLTQVPPLAKAAIPALESTRKVVGDHLLPRLPEIRPYAPDLVAGLFNGYGGTTAAPYDANGHYARISFQGSVFSTPNLGNAVPRPPSQQGLTGYRTGVQKRCPGAAVQTAPDQSNPFIPFAGFPCSKEDSPR
jgi:phospholipid/cholesterol/gamma-HCH transport system substrate-binding protein